MGRLIVFEGIDGAGKSTQFEILCKRLNDEGKNFRRLRFPRYDNDSSALIRMYLGGQFGEKPGDVNAYASSTFYAVDRFASYASDWKRYYDDGGIILTDRYTTSNAIHQGSKISGDERREFLTWLYDFEFEKLGLPRPDAVIYLDIPVQLSIEHIRSRSLETGVKADIHELDTDYLQNCHDCGTEAAKMYGWQKIDCAPEGKMRAIDDIADEIYSCIKGKVL